MKSLPLAHTSWLRPFVAFFEERDVDLLPFIRSADIEPALVLDGEGWITKHQLYQFLNAVAEGTHMPELGFVVGERLTPDTIGAIGAAMTSASTLGAAIQLFCRLVPRHVEDNRVWVEEGDEGGVWLFNETVDRLPGESDLADHAGLMSLVNIVRLAAGRDWRPTRVTLQAGPTGAHRRVPTLNACSMEFDAPATGVAFPAAYLLRPIRPRPTRTSGENALLSGKETFHDKLRQLLRGILGVGGILPSAHLVAEVAGTSARTLHRRLRDEGQTYQEILDEIRFERAAELLSNSDASVKELAHELGFSGPNNFIRYFQRVAGVSPSAYRKDHEKKA